MTDLEEAAREWMEAHDHAIDMARTSDDAAIGWAEGHEHEAWLAFRAAYDTFPAAPSPALTREALPDESHFVALATAVLNVRDFLALHRKATGRSDVNIRKVLALLDDALSEVPPPSSTREETQHLT